MEPIPILFIAYHFPPVGGPGVQRSLKFVRYLPGEGFVPIVVAGPARGVERWEPEDRSLLEEIPAESLVYRPEEGPRRARKTTALYDKILHRSPSRFRWWREKVLEIGLEAARKNRVRLVFVTASPYESIEPALEIGKRCGIPVVADLRDPWALDETVTFPTGVHRLLHRRMMGRTLSGADLVILNTPEAHKSVCGAFPFLAERARWVTNGYDPEDFGNQDYCPKERFVITHTGYMFTDVGLGNRRAAWLKAIAGGRVAPVDLLARSPLFLIRAIEQLVGQWKSLRERLAVRFVGGTTPADVECVRHSPARSLVKFEGQVSHREAVRAMETSDLLFLPMHGLPRGVRARVVPAKLYEYLASGRPILATVPEGDARDFIEEAHAGDVVPPRDVDGLARAILAYVEKGPTPTRRATASVTRFSRRRLTKEIAVYFRQLLR